MEIPEDLLCLYTAEVRNEDGTFAIDVPERELTYGDLTENGRYRVALFPAGDGSETLATPIREQEPAREPPVSEGDRRIVQIENIGDQGDGIARVERGYVVIVPDTSVGDEVAVEIEDLHPNFAMASVVDGNDTAPVS